ncbi:hypothetical protein M3664_04875 [Paenibacillus lautus]|uniref:hypothetical protein n=1 Tax=Paenibacillus lautus TaxID=1401 RepID=UPI00204166A7|nr:hypothetical protein [Paenibacillus lautus]MCM3257116.1 hypothetical protein [Paenibacillus lautus]
MTKQMKQPFHPEIDKPCFIKGINKKGIVKEWIPTGRTKVTYFSRENDKRITAWFSNSQLEEHRPVKRNNEGGSIDYSRFKSTLPHLKETVLSKNEVEKLLKSIGTLKNPLGDKKENHTSQFQQAREFHKAFNCPAPDTPTPLSDKLAINRAAYIVEEVIELLHATAGDDERFDEFYDELINRAQKSYKKQLTKEYPKYKLIGQIDAFTDILYFGNGGFVEMGVIPDPIYNLVHNSNMAKIFPDGKPHYNEVGKVIKPEGWEENFAPEPKIEEEIKNQIELGLKRFKN